MTHSRGDEDRSLDGLFEVLADERRRHALDCLHGRELPLALADLAEEVTVRETDTPITEISSEAARQISLSLYHVHLPKLEEAGIVRYDRGSDTVTLAEDSERLWDCVEFLGTE